MITEPVLCECGEDADFRADGLAIDDRTHDAEGQQVFCLRCYVQQPGPTCADGSTPFWLL